MKNVVGLALSALALAVSQGISAQQLTENEIEIVEVKGNASSLLNMNPADNSFRYLIVERSNGGVKY